MTNLPQERLAIAVAADRRRRARCWTITIEYVKEREAFGRPLGKFQNTRFELAEMATECADRPRPSSTAASSSTTTGGFDAVDAAMAKWWTTELQKRVVDRCLQLHGGYGYMTRVPGRPGLHRRPHPDHLRRHDRDHEGDHRPLALL